VLIGNLGADPEMRDFGKDKRVVNLRMATNEYYKDANGDKQERTTWHRVVAWNNQARFLADACKKGSRLLVEGKLENKRWEKDGEPRYSTEIRLNEFMLLDDRKKN